jgi:hypothetical protein
MDGTVDSTGLRVHWHVENIDAEHCTIDVDFDDLHAKRIYTHLLSREEAERVARELAHQLLLEAAAATMKAR